MRNLSLQRRVAPAALVGLMLASLGFAGCQDPMVDRPDGGLLDFLDARGITPPPEPPTVAPVVTPQPYEVVTLRGTTNGRRVVVEGFGNPIATTAFRDEWCIDVPTPTPGPYVFRLFAQGADGQVSTPATVVNVEYDPSAPGDANAQTCSGSHPGGCPGAIEICDNNRDDDCNNLVDDQDPACATCLDDALEPNNDVNAPRIDPGRHDNLQLCPGNSDFYGIFTRRPSTITVRAFFSHATGNVDLQLLDRDLTTTLERSLTMTDDELITYTATATGEYKLVVFAGDGATNRYALDIQVVEM